MLPAAPKLRTVLILGCDGHQATAAMTGALQSPYEVSGAAFLPAASAARSGVDYVCRAAASVIAIRIEGPDQSVEYRCAALRAALAEFGPTEELHGHNSAAFWREMRDVLPFAGDTRIVWKISVPPSDGARVADSLDGDAFLDWGGGLIWLAVDAADGAHQAVRTAIAGCGGHATLIRAPAELRAAIAVFQPEEPGLARLSAGLKASFDPRGVLNPGRIYAGV